MKLRKKLIEVALPLEAINKAAAHEKMPGIGPHPRGLHYWPARRPLSAARAVIFAQMVDDPSSHPELFPTEKAQEKERQRLFKIIEDLVQWENTTNEAFLQKAREEIWQSWRYACADNADHPQAAELFNRHVLPAFHDPFAGGGALPLEAQRLGLESYASDLNPVAVLINKAMIEIPPKFAGRPPVNPKSRAASPLANRTWRGAEGLAEDVRYYGHWMRDRAQERIGHLYPKVEITDDIIAQRPDLRKYSNQKLTVIAWIWVRTVNSPDPAFADVEVPLASTFMLSTKVGKEAYVQPVIDGREYRFTVNVGKPDDPEAAKNGTKLARGAKFMCLLSGNPIAPDYIKAEGVAGRMGSKLMAIVAEGDRGRVYLSPDQITESLAKSAKPQWAPTVDLPDDPRNFWTVQYGLTKFADLFTPRQMVALTTFSDLVHEVREQVEQDLQLFAAKVHKYEDLGLQGLSYANVIALYLAFGVDRCADFNNSCTRWVPGNQKVMNLFNKQSIPMTWDYSEAAILNDVVGGFLPAVEFISNCLLKMPSFGFGTAVQMDAARNTLSSGKVVSTDPPYYDNVGYSDLSDFFYVWDRRVLKESFPELFSTISVPKMEELVANPYRHGSSSKAESFFLQGMTGAMAAISRQAHCAFPATIYYAFKQSEESVDDGLVNTGWDTFLGAVIEAGFAITGTWPIRSEQEHRMVGMGTNALASSIVLVCRKGFSSGSICTRRELVDQLRRELPNAMLNLQAGNIAPVDLAQAAIGPGMAVFTRFEKVVDAEGKQVTVREALSLINQVLDEALAEQEGDFDADTRWALAWFEQNGFAEGEFGVAETLSKAKNTSIGGLADAGILVSARGKVRLLRPSELPSDWDPTTDRRLTAWETVHHLVRAYESGGENAAAALVAKLGSKAEAARELCYRLYTICERKKRPAEALSYNGLVQAWPEIVAAARDGVVTATAQTDLDI